MSYDFMMMKPRVDLRSPNDIEADVLLQQDPETVVSALSVMLPCLLWSREKDGGWFGWFDDEDTWYEFRIDPEPDYIWIIRTSHLTNTRNLVPDICKTLGLIAFDGQAGVLIGSG